jgi:hypothetical protein
MASQVEKRMVLTLPVVLVVYSSNHFEHNLYRHYDRNNPFEIDRVSNEFCFGRPFHRDGFERLITMVDLSLKNNYYSCFFRLVTYPVF